MKETLIEPRRPQDRTFRGNIVQAMQAYASGDLGEIPIPLCNVDRIISIGSDRMMAAVKVARRTVLQPSLAAQHKAIGSINSPMQCMLKEICAQCLQRHVDPETGKERSSLVASIRINRLISWISTIFAPGFARIQWRKS